MVRTTTLLLVSTTEIVTCARMIVAACEARKASSAYLHFKRLDYPEMDPAEWHKWLVIRKQGEDVAVYDRPIAFWGDFERLLVDDFCLVRLAGRDAKIS